MKQNTLAITKHVNGVDYWIITHGWNNNSFHTYLLTSSGLSTTAVTTNIGNIITGTRFDAAGITKISPSGSKLAFSSVCGFVQLFDFNNSTGVLSNAQTLLTESGELYGLEFSPSETVLYVTNSLTRKFYQFNLSAADIPSSKIELYNGPLFLGALQLGPDEKIYVAVNSQNKIGVINNPDVVGLGCNLQMNAIDLAGRTCELGLPAFNQSFFFNPEIKSTNTCLGQNSQFTIDTNQIITSVVWDFGDSSPTQNSIIGNHIYTTPGTYTVTATVTGSAGISTKTREIKISAVPTATQPQNILACDNDNNGFYNFDLTSRKLAILNGQDENQFLIRYFANAADYASNIAIVTPTSYPNAVAYQQQTIIAEVYNKENGDCKTTTTFSIDVFDSPKPATTIPLLESCDNITFGTDTDGKIRFDLTQRASVILNGQSAAQFTIEYYTDVALTNRILPPSNYVNTSTTETIYVKVINVANVSCFASTSFQIRVNPLPTINNIVTLKQCDDNTDGFSSFNLNEAKSLISSNYMNETFTFHTTLLDAQNNTNPITNLSTYVNPTVSNAIAFVRVSNSYGCYRTSQLNLNVSTTQIPLNFQRVFTACDDAILGTNTDGISAFDFSNVTTQIQSLFPLGQQLIISYYKNLTDALAEQNAITNITNYRNVGSLHTQNIYIRVDSATNNDCLGLGQHITLNVERIPIVQPQVFVHCDDNQDGLYGFDTTNLQTSLLNGLSNVSVLYFDQSNNPLPSPLPNPFITGNQTVKVIVKNNTTTACDYQTTITFTVDDLPEAFSVPSNLTSACDDEIDPSQQNGMYSFDTSTFQNTILGTQTGMIVNYYDDRNNLLSTPLPNPFVSATQNIRVEVSNPLNTNCIATTTIPLVVKPRPNLPLTGNGLVCNEQTLTKRLEAQVVSPSTSTTYSYVWKQNGVVIPNKVDDYLDVTQAGTYVVEVTNSQGCTSTRIFEVIASGIAVIQNVQITQLSDSNSIAIYVKGQGNYVYSIDGVNYQTENTFSGISAGIYTVFVKDLNGCGIAGPKEVSILGIPKFFTPNNDGYNDSWNIEGANSILNAQTQILIFDRYGKLLKQISPVGQGWDGTFNGEQLASDDYWYSITLENGQIIKGHFALKR